jgi:hypothetical protein
MTRQNGVSVANGSQTARSKKSLEWLDLLGKTEVAEKLDDV